MNLLPENVMAMGDEENNLSMLKWDGLGVAIAKETANAVTTRTNDESGVAEAIEKYILNA